MSDNNVKLDAVYIQNLREQICDVKSTEKNLYRKKEELQEELERQMGDIQKDIYAARYVAATKQSQVNEYTNMHRPSVALPQEILSMIFHHVIGFVWGKLRESEDFTHMVAMQFILSYVCRRWRGVVLGDPKLWSQIYVFQYQPYDFGLFLSRSEGLPLEISFRGGWSPHLQDIFRGILGREALRWQRLDLEIDVDTLGPFFRLIECGANSLSYIHLAYSFTVEGFRSSPYLAAHQDKLHTLILEVRSSMFTENLIVPHLQHFTLIGCGDESYDNWNLSYLQCFLSSTTNLRSLRLGINGINFKSKPDTTRTSISLPHLHQLSFYFEYRPVRAEHLSDLLDMISAPGLQAIEFSSSSISPVMPSHTVGFDFWKRVLGRGRRRYPTVTTAILHNVIHTVSDAQLFVEAFPNITNLTADEAAIMMSLQVREINKLTHCPSGPVQPFELVAKPDSLTSIRIYINHGCFNRDRDDDVFYNCFASLLAALRRNQSHVPLLRLELVVDPKHRERISEWLEELGQYALVVTMSSPLDDVDAPWYYWRPHWQK